MFYWTNTGALSNRFYHIAFLKFSARSTFLFSVERQKASPLPKCCKTPPPMLTIGQFSGFKSQVVLACTRKPAILMH